MGDHPLRIHARDVVAVLLVLAACLAAWAGVVLLGWALWTVAT